MTTLPSRLALAAAMLAGAPLAAQIPPSEYAARRDSVAARLGEGVLIAFGAPAPNTDLSDFQQMPSFAYLTGYQRWDAALVMTVRNGRITYQMLFEPPTDPRRALYDGFPPDSADLARRTGLGVTSIERLRGAVESQLGRGPLWFVSDVHTRDALFSDTLTRGRRFVADLWAARRMTVRSADPLLDSLRVAKSPLEIALLRRAIDQTTAGFCAAFARVAPGVNENLIHATTDFAFRQAGASGPSFRGILGSGPNSTSYHYRANDRVMQAGEVMVMDIGALYQGYGADVTRTVPVSGRFSPGQAAVYRLVREAQAAAEAVARAGAPVAAGDTAIRVVLARGLTALGLIDSVGATIDPPWSTPERCARVPAPLNCTQAFLFMAHGPGHGIGLEVHDVGGYSSSFSGRFTLNEVFTIEPGIYISTMLLDMLPDTEKNRRYIARVRPLIERFNHTGVRIEDDYLVTANGVEWLSRAPRELADVESAMRNRGTGGLCGAGPSR